MALKARSPSVAMTATPLSQAQTARLHASASGECHRLKSEHRLLRNELRILDDLQVAEGRLDSAHVRSPRYTELSVKAVETIRKTADVDDQLLRVGNERGGALSQASVSSLGTMTIIERVHFTRALEPQEFKDGAVLIKEGEPRDAFLIIVQGQVSCAAARPPVRSRPRPRRPSGAPQHARASACGRPGAPPSKSASRRETQCRAPPRAPGASRL